jgi:hypothetical protein
VSEGAIGRGGGIPLAGLITGFALALVALAVLVTPAFAQVSAEPGTEAALPVESGTEALDAGSAPAPEPAAASEPAAPDPPPPPAPEPYGAPAAEPAPSPTEAPPGPAPAPEPAPDKTVTPASDPSTTQQPVSSGDSTETGHQGTTPPPSPSQPPATQTAPPAAAGSPLAAPSEPLAATKLAPPTAAPMDPTAETPPAAPELLAADDPPAETAGHSRTRAEAPVDAVFRHALKLMDDLAGVNAGMALLAREDRAPAAPGSAPQPDSAPVRHDSTPLASYEESLPTGGAPSGAAGSTSAGGGSAAHYALLIAFAALAGGLWARLQLVPVLWRSVAIVALNERPG